jgi:hypothetical protein
MTTETMTVDDIMAAVGFAAARAGGGNWMWVKSAADGSRLCVCTLEGSIDGEPEVAEWYAGRQSEDGFVECNEALTLADAIEIVERLPSPITPGGQITSRLSRREIEAA